MVTSSIPLQEQLAEVGREIAMRHSVYPRRVRDGKMTQAQADRQIDIGVRNNRGTGEERRNHVVVIPSIKFTGPDGMEWIIYGLTPYYADRFMAMIHAYQRAYEEQCARASTSISPPIPTSGDHLADAHTTTPNTTT